MRTSRWMSVATAVAAGVSALYLAGCSSDRATAPNAVDAAPTAFSITPAAVSMAATARNLKITLFETIPRLEAKMQRAGLRQNLVNSPYDLTFNGGAVVTHSAERNVFLNCPQGPAACWGTGNVTPTTFLRDLDRSSMIQIANQYLGEDAFARFRQVTELAANGIPFAVDTMDHTPTATRNDIIAILAGAVQASGLQAGYTNEYHLYFPQGTNVCPSPNNCYSPNNPATFAFCAFHSTVDFTTASNDTLHVLFSVEPYQFVPGCAGPTQPRLIDATASTLSHEFMETITDPDGTAWFNDLTGNEIGDLCFTFRNPENVDGHTYVIQEEYSNTVHACTDGSF